MWFQAAPGQPACHRSLNPVRWEQRLPITAKVGTIMRLLLLPGVAKRDGLGHGYP